MRTWLSSFDRTVAERWSAGGIRCGSTVSAGSQREHPDDTRVGFVNVAWDCGDHAFLLVTKTRGSHQRRGIGTTVVRRAAEQAKAAGCEWLHVDFEADLDGFYFDA
jgi:GNAT superfamily N-acetyltransferase